MSVDDDDDGDNEDSVDDDDHEASGSSDDDTTSFDKGSSSDDSSDSSYSTSSYSTASSSGSGGGVLTPLVLLAVLGFIVVGYQEWTHAPQPATQAHQVTQAPQVTCTGISPDGTSCYSPEYKGWVARNSQGQVVRVPGPDVSRPSPPPNPYCGAAEKFGWYFTVLCHDQELAALNKRVGHLNTIFEMTGSGPGPFESAHWQAKVGKICKEDKSPPDCLRSALESRSQWLQAQIPIALASNRPGLFKEQARQMWEHHNW